MQKDSFDWRRKIRAKLDARDIDEAAKRALTGYGPEVFGYLVRVMADEESAEEVYSQFCENLWRGLPRFERKSSFEPGRTHLARNARNQFWRTWYRRLGRRLQTDEANQIQVLARSTTLIRKRTETKDQLAAIRQELEPDERELLVLRVDRRMSWRRSPAFWRIPKVRWTRQPRWQCQPRFANGSSGCTRRFEDSSRSEGSWSRARASGER